MLTLSINSLAVIPLAAKSALYNGYESVCTVKTQETALISLMAVSNANRENHLQKSLLFKQCNMTEEWMGKSKVY